MSGYIVIYMVLLTVNIFGPGLTSGKEIPMGVVGEAIKEIIINIPDTDAPETVIQISGLNDTISIDDSQADDAKIRHVRDVDGKQEENKTDMREEDIPMEIFSRIFAALKMYQKMNLTEMELVKRFWCRINVTKLLDIDEKVLLEASNLMDKEVKTCPLEKEIVLIKPIVELLTKAEIPTVKAIIVMINTTLNQLLSPEDLEKLKNSTEGRMIFMVMEKMKNHFDKNPDHTIFQMLGGLLCSIDQIDLSKLSTKTIMDIINSIDNTKCTMQQQRAILEKFVKMFSIRRWLDPVNIFGFFNSDKFQILTQLLEISSNELKTFYAIVSTLKENKVVDWTIMDLGERIVCSLDQTNVSMIDDKVLATLLPKLLQKPECSQDLLKKKWSALMSSVGNVIKGLLLPQIPEVAKEIDKLSMGIMSGLKNVNWTEAKIELKKVLEMLNGFADKIIANVDSISERKWTLQSLLKNFVCGLNITDFTKLDDQFPMKMLNNLGKLDLCKQAEEEPAWNKFLYNLAKLNTMGIMDGLKEINDSIKMGDIRKYITDEQIQSLQTTIKSMIPIPGLDTVIGKVWGEIKKNPDQQLSVNYVLRFMACHVKTSEIAKMDLDKLMTIASKFGQPVTCKTPTSQVWLEDALTEMMKFMTNMGFEQLDELNKYIGSFTSKDLKWLANEVKRMKTLAIASLKKLDKKSDEWISHVKKEASIDIAASVRQLICFFSKGKFSSIDDVIKTMGELGQCSAAESKKSTEDFLKELSKMEEGEVMKEMLVGLGILSGQFDVKKMQDLIAKMTGKIEEYAAKFWSIIPKEIKELTIAKVLKMVSNEIAPLDELLSCVVKSIAFPAFGQPKAPDFIACFSKFVSGSRGKKPVVVPGKKPGGKLEDRYKVGDDFPFKENSMGNMDEVLQKLLDFNRESNSEKEKRILQSAEKRVIEYLLKNPTKLDAALSTNKKQILEMASKVKLGAKIMYRMKIDSDSLAMVKKIATPQQAKKLLKKAFTDMKMETKTVSEKKDFLEKLPADVMMKSGTQLIDKLFSEATKDVFIQRFRRKEKPDKTEETNDDEEEEEEDEEQSLAKLSLVNKLFDKASDNATLSSMMDTTLVSVISVNMLKKLPEKEMCSMKADTLELKEDQVQLLVNKCPKAVEEIAKTNASSLGKVATKVTKPIVDSLNLKELIGLTSEACKYERKLDIDLERVFKDHYITQKLNPMENATSMFCVLKYVETDLPWEKPTAIEICKTLGSSIMKNIQPKRAEIFKSKCMDLLKKGNITFADMGAMNAFLKMADIENLKPETILQGAIVLARYVWDSAVFSEIGKKLSTLTSFKKRSSLTTDQVAQAGIFIAAWDDADTIPNLSVLQTFDSIATGVRQLQRKKLLCLKKGKAASKCNVMDKVLAKIVQILIKATTATSSRRKRSTKASCRCTNLVNLGVAAVQVPASQMSEMICDTDFNECMEGLSQITDWNQDHRKVLVEKAIKVWGEPSTWNSSDVAIASAAIPGLTTAQIKVLSLYSTDATFDLGKQNNWVSGGLTEMFLVFLKNLKNNNISEVTSFDLRVLGNIVCGISAENIGRIPDMSYINAASQIGSLEICSEEQRTAWANKALAVYGKNIHDWGLAEIASIGSVISGLSTLDLQKLNRKQISAISVKAIPKIAPAKLASLYPAQIGYLTASQVQMVTSAQKEKMTAEQKDILNKKILESSVSDDAENGGSTIGVSGYIKLSILLVINAILVVPSARFFN